MVSLQQTLFALVQLVVLAAATTNLHQHGSANRKKHCNSAFFKSILRPGSQLERVDSLDEGSTYGEDATNVAYPTQPTGIPGSCAAVIKVTSSPSSSYRIGIILPDDWNDRFLVVGNGGFGGGINWPDVVCPSCHHEFLFCLLA